MIRGRQFSGRLFAFGWRTVLVDRIPFLVNRVLAPELTVPVLVLAIAGAMFLLRRRFPEGLLLVLGFGAIFGFALNYAVVDTPVFLVPAILVLVLTAAVASEQVVRFVASHVPQLAPVIAACALIVPGWDLTRNFSANDLSRDTEALVYFDRLFATLPNHTVLVREDFLVDRMVAFKLLGDRSAGGRQILLAAPDASRLRDDLAHGFSVFGFSKSIGRMHYDAMDFDFAPYGLLGGRLSELLSGLPDGTIVAIAVPAVHTPI